MGETKSGNVFGQLLGWLAEYVVGPVVFVLLPMAAGVWLLDAWEGHKVAQEVKLLTEEELSPTTWLKRA